MTITVTHSIAHAAGWDAAQRHATEHGRTVWNEDDYNVAAATFDALMELVKPVTRVQELRGMDS